MQWRRFAADVESVFTMVGPEQTLTLTPNPNNPNPNYPNPQPQPQPNHYPYPNPNQVGLEKTPHETPTSRVLQHNPHTLHPAAREEAVQALLEALRQRVHTRRVLVKPFFADYEQQVITLPQQPQPSPPP